jgi:hypothetical protein
MQESQEPFKRCTTEWSRHAVILPAAAAAAATVSAVE